jgi:hypothetical protein
VHLRGLAIVAKKAKLQTQKLQSLYKELLRDIEFLAIRSADFYNKKRLKGPRLQKGDKVYLLRRNIEITRPSSKLDHKKFEPFRIKRNIRDISYKLELPKIIRIHPVFHISLLKPADSDTPKGPAPKLHPNTQQEEYKVEAILDVKLQRRQLK